MVLEFTIIYFQSQRMSFSNTILYKYKFTVILGLLIVFLSLLPSSSFPSNPITRWGGFDKLIHVSMYTLLAFTIYFEMRCSKNCLLRYSLTGAGILAFSSMLEIFQGLFNSLERSAEVLDFVANLIGICSGFILYRFYRSLKS